MSLTPILEEWLRVQEQIAAEKKLADAKQRTRRSQQPCIFDIKPKRGKCHKHWSEK